MKYVIGILIVVAAMFILGCLPAVMNLITDYRTDSFSEDFVLSTNATSTNGTVQLSKQLWESSTVYASLASNSTSDTPAMTGYNNGNRLLSLNGLASNTSRLLTVDYKSAGLTDYTGADTATKIIPVIYILSVVFVTILSIVFIVIRG